ncbi:hypothetical protein ACOMICROBIO_GDFFDHBD_00741 [Vibrio sp. B1REV9]|nr:hypothetical protein ACOMICROBIO_GDFFDHBD_00741 [Vibrio sp. B1REV9]
MQNYAFYFSGVHYSFLSFLFKPCHKWLLLNFASQFIIIGA